MPFKVYTSLEPTPLPLEFHGSAGSTLDAIAGTVTDANGRLTLETVTRLCYFANGITRVLRRHGQQVPFRAAACTGALYHIELYLVCADLAHLRPGAKHLDSKPRGEGSEPHVALEAGVYHYAAHDNALRLLRRGDFRGVLNSATGDEPGIAQAPVTMVCTSTFWRNAWKYQARAYRHAFWDTGTIVANLLSVASANGVPARLIVGFADTAVNQLLDVDPTQEATVCLVALGRGAAPASIAPPVVPLRLPTQPLSAKQVDYPPIIEAHAASSLASGAAASAWRSASIPAVAMANAAESLARGRSASSIEQVILRRGSSRRFALEPIGLEPLMDMLIAATRPIPSDVQNLTQPFLIISSVEGLAPGKYVFHRAQASLELLKAGDFRQEASRLDLGQDLAGQAAVNVYWLADLNMALARLGARGYRAAQLEAAVEGGKLYLAAYALGLGATGLTFFDDEVTRFFSPHAASKGVMFLIAVGHPAKRRV